MPSDLPFDEELAQRLPLPLAQLYRRAHNASTLRDRHDTVYHLWEAALKLLASVAVTAYLETGATPDDQLRQSLQNLARPSVGQWWEIVRRLTVNLNLLLGKARDDMSRAAGLDAALLTTLEGRKGSRSNVHLATLFDRLVTYRNMEVGHGAFGQRGSQHYEQMGSALLAGVPQVLDRLDVLAGRKLIYVAEVRRLGTGGWSADRYELVGEAPRRLEALKLPQEEIPSLVPQQIYLAGTALQSMQPLVTYEQEANEFLFLNARRGKQRIQYLCYTSGRQVDRAEPAAQNELLSQLLKMPVDDGQQQPGQTPTPSEGVPAEPETEPLRRLGEFELLSELGRGGMGIVYRARQPSLGRLVAVKSLIRTSDPRAEARFGLEIAALGRVSHPHLIQIFTSGSEREHYFYAMELVEGTTLGSVCAALSSSGSSADQVDMPTWAKALSTACEEARRSEKPLTMEDASDAPVPSGQPLGAPAEEPAEIKSPDALQNLGRGQNYVRHITNLVRQVAGAVHALHEKGIIHRDIKPQNIMIGPDGKNAVLMDLGLAQIADEVEGRLTKTRQFIGTLRYSSPEQVLAVNRANARSDVYSLGATLWEMLALRPLFGATEATPDAVVMQQIMANEPERLQRLNPAVPRDLEAIVHKCLEKDPVRRYESAQALSEDLGRYLAGETVRARPVREIERAWKWMRRRPAVAALFGISVVSLLGMASLAVAWRAAALRKTAPTMTITRPSPQIVARGQPFDLPIKLEHENHPAATTLTFLDTTDAQNPVLIGPEEIASGQEFAEVHATVPAHAQLGRHLIRIQAQGEGQTAETMLDLTVVFMPSNYHGEGAFTQDSRGTFFYPRIVTQVGGKAVRFLLIPGEKDFDSFYMMENKVSNLLGHAYDSSSERQGKPKIAAPSMENNVYPLFNVGVEEALGFARWLQGDLPTVRQWDRAAGLISHDPNHPEGPYLGKWLGKGSLDIALGGTIKPVGTSKDDVSPYGIRDMAGNGLEWTRSIYSNDKTVPLKYEGDKSQNSVVVASHSFNDHEPLKFSELREMETRPSFPYKHKEPTLGFRVVIEPHDVVAR